MSLLGTFLPGETQTVPQGNQGEGQRVHGTSGFVSIWKTLEISAQKPSERIWGCLIIMTRTVLYLELQHQVCRVGWRGIIFQCSFPKFHPPTQQRAENIFVYFLKSTKEWQKMKLLEKSTSLVLFFLTLHIQGTSPVGLEDQESLW